MCPKLCPIFCQNLDDLTNLKLFMLNRFVYLVVDEISYFSGFERFFVGVTGET